MALTASTPPPPNPRAARRAQRSAERAPARWPGQLAAYLVVVLALGLLCAWADARSTFVLAAGALGLGVAVGVLSPVGAAFRNLSGVVVAMLVVFVAVLLLAWTDGQLLGERPWLAVLAAGLLTVGLDWRFVPRLRARAVLSGVLVVPVAGAGAAWAYAGALTWFVALLGTLWLLEQDQRHAVMRPVPLTEAPDEDRARPADLARTLAIALAVGLLATVVFGDLRCTLRPPGTDPDLPTIDSPAVREPLGSASGDAQRFVQPSGGGTAVTDGRGELRARIDGDRITVYRDGVGQTFRRDATGRLRATDAEGWTYEVDEDGRLTVRDPEGRVRVAADERGASAEAGADAAGDDTGSDRPDVPWRWIALGLVACAALAALALWLARRRSSRPPEPSSWAERLARRLDAEGRGRGRGRERGETVLHHTAALADGPLPDPRVRDVGAVVSGALYGRDEPEAGARDWADRVVDEVTDRHPRPRRRR